MQQEEDVGQALFTTLMICVLERTGMLLRGCRMESGLTVPRRCSGDSRHVTNINHSAVVRPEKNSLTYDKW